jgi:hypothetical protein
MVQHLNESQNGDPVTGVVPKSGDSTCSIGTSDEGRFFTISRSLPLDKIQRTHPGELWAITRL